MVNTVGQTAFFPPSNRNLLNFITFLHEGGLTGGTITTYLSAISFICKLIGCPDPSTSFACKKLLGAVRKTDGDPDSRLPITPPILEKLIACLPTLGLSPFGVLVMTAAYTLAFHGFLRISEFTESPDNKHNIKVNHVCWQKDQLGRDVLQVSIMSFKNKGNRGAVTLLVGGSANLAICPVLACSRYLSVRPPLPGALFLWEDGVPLARETFSSLLKYNLQVAGLSDAFYKSHSFRIGACTYASSCGMSDEKIKKMGRWASNAFQRYVRVPTRDVSFHT